MTGSVARKLWLSLAVVTAVVGTIFGLLLLVASAVPRPDTEERVWQFVLGVLAIAASTIGVRLIYGWGLWLFEDERSERGELRSSDGDPRTRATTARAKLRGRRRRRRDAVTENPEGEARSEQRYDYALQALSVGKRQRALWVVVLTASFAVLCGIMFARWGSFGEDAGDGRPLNWAAICCYLDADPTLGLTSRSTPTVEARMCARENGIEPYDLYEDIHFAVGGGVDAVTVQAPA